MIFANLAIPYTQQLKPALFLSSTKNAETQFAINWPSSRVRLIEYTAPHSGVGKTISRRRGDLCIIYARAARERRPRKDKNITVKKKIYRNQTLAQISFLQYYSARSNEISFFVLQRTIDIMERERDISVSRIAPRFEEGRKGARQNCRASPFHFPLRVYIKICGCVFQGTFRLTYMAD